MELNLYKIDLKSILKICSIGLLGYIPLAMMIVISMINREPYPVGPIGKMYQIGLEEIIYANISLLMYALINLVVVVIAIWCWSRFFAIKINVQ